MERLSLLLLFATILATCHANSPLIDLTIDIGNPLPSSPSARFPASFPCAHWVNKVVDAGGRIRRGDTVPAECAVLVRHSALGKSRRALTKLITDEAARYAKSLTLKGDGMEIWIFDVDETALSNTPYFANHGFGVEQFNETSFNEWVDSGNLPAIPETLELFNTLISLGIKVVFLSGREEIRRQVTVNNLEAAGYRNWEKLLLRGPPFSSTEQTYDFKYVQREQLQQESLYRIVGIIGDQLGDFDLSLCDRNCYPLPYPMYYIPY